MLYIFYIRGYIEHNVLYTIVGGNLKNIYD